MSIRTRLSRPFGRVGFAALAAAVVGGACSSSGASEAEGGVERLKVTVAVPGPTELFNVPVLLADELGFYEDEGLDAELIDVKTGAGAVHAVVTGDADMGSGFQGHAINMTSKRQPLRSFVTTMDTLGMGLSVPPGRKHRVEEIADLKGAVVGVSAPGSGSHMFLNYLLNKHGLSPEDVQVAAIGLGAGAVAAVEHGQVDAAVTVEPTLSRLQQRVDGLQVVVDTRTEAGRTEVFGTGGVPSMGVYARAGWLDENPEAARKMAAAVTRALTWIAGHDAAEIADAMPNAYALEDRALYVSTMETAKQTFSTDGRLSAGAAEAALRVLTLSLPEVAAADIDLAATYTNEFLPRP